MTFIFCSIGDSMIFGGSPKGSRGGGSKLCKQDVDGKIDLKKLCDSSSSLLKSRTQLNINSSNKWCHN